MRRQYHDNLYRFAAPQPSYWEAEAADISVDARPLESDESCDVAIIGGGYTGLSAAMHLARDYAVEVRVLEAGHIGWGASGRNGGFCSMGGTAVHGADLIRICGEDSAREYYQSQIEAVELVREIGETEQLDFRPRGEAEVTVAHTKKAFAGLRRDYDACRNVLGLDAELLGQEEARRLLFDSAEQFGALRVKPGFGLYPLRFCKGMANAALRHGATLHPRSEVTDWTKDQDGRHRLATQGGTVRARHVVFATNGFVPESLRAAFYARSMPVISAIVVTRPLTDEELAAQQWCTKDVIANSRRVLNYFRILPDRRLLFGGRGALRGSPDEEQENYRALGKTIARLWPAWQDVGIDYRWHGLICINASLYPSIGQLDEDPSIFFGFGYHGCGVNTATWTGKQLADWIGKSKSPAGLPAIVKGLGKRYPFPRLRPAYLRLMMAFARWMDDRR